MSLVSNFLLQVCSGLEPHCPGENEWLYWLCVTYRFKILRLLFQCPTEEVWGLIFFFSLSSLFCTFRHLSGLGT